MRKILVILLLLFVGVVPALAQTLPVGAVLVGEFPAGFNCYSFVIEGYQVNVIYMGGSLKEGIALRILTSPDNQVIPTGYVFLNRDGRNSYITWRINGITLFFVPESEGGCQVWMRSG